MIEYLMFFIIIFALLITTFIFIYKYHSIKKRYKNIADIDEEITLKRIGIENDYKKLEEYKQHTEKNINKEIALNRLTIENNNKKMFEFKENTKKKIIRLNNTYIANKKIFHDLKREIELLEENIELMSYGLYKPYFSFNSSKEYKDALEKNYEHKKLMIKDDKAAICNTQWLVNNSKTQGRIHTQQYLRLMLRAFNGECDSCISKVKWNNITTIESRLKKTFTAINKLGEKQNALISEEYFDIRMQELYLTYEYQEKMHEEKEEVRRNQEQMRQEQKAMREIEKARKEAENEEIRYEKALDRARKELEQASENEKAQLIDTIEKFKIELQKAKELKERAISMAQITKAGFVYIISNIGLLGENAYKIGMTRRIDPVERVRELSGASVPFPYDIHAMIYSENAPDLEYSLHKMFNDKRINKINFRKEFFRLNLKDIEMAINEKGYKCTFIEIPEARDYRQSKYYEEQGIKVDNQFPDSLIGYDEENEDFLLSND